MKRKISLTLGKAALIVWSNWQTDCPKTLLSWNGLLDSEDLYGAPVQKQLQTQSTFSLFKTLTDLDIEMYDSLTSIDSNNIILFVHHINSRKLLPTTT